MRGGAVFIFLSAALIATVASAQVHVRGYTRSDGTYVAPHYRSSPNSTTSDNYSTRGNVNPYTGAVGTRAPEPSISAAPAYVPYLPAVPAASYPAPAASYAEMPNEGAQAAPPPPSILTGSDIFEHCGPQASFSQKDVCVGYLNGVNDTVDGLALADLVKKPFCFSANLTVGELATLTATAIQQDSSTWTRSSVWVLLDVWTRMFPCPDSADQ